MNKFFVLFVDQVPFGVGDNLGNLLNRARKVQKQQPEKILSVKEFSEDDAISEPFSYTPGEKD